MPAFLLLFQKHHFPPTNQDQAVHCFISCTFHMAFYQELFTCQTNHFQAAPSFQLLHGRDRSGRCLPLTSLGSQLCLAWPYSLVLGTQGTWHRKLTSWNRHVHSMLQASGILATWVKPSALFWWVSLNKYIYLFATIFKVAVSYFN